jgi:membrane associated rhomboid family serine protease
MAWHPTWNDSPPPRRGGFFADRGGLFPPGVKLVLLLTIAVFLMEAVWGSALVALGALTVESLMHGEIWRLLSYMFLHANSTHLLVNMFMFWMLGSVFERQIGTRRFLLLYFACGIAGGLFEAAFNYLMFLKFGPTFLTMPAVGASAGVMGILVAFATLNPREKFLVFFLLPVEAWWVAVVYGLFETWPILKDLVFSQNPMWGDNVAHAAHFGGMVVGFVWMKWGERIARLLRRGSAPREKVFYGRTPEEEDAEVDRILDKIRDEGLDSLTLREKMFLHEVSRRRRGGP